ncbi:MAG: hypothetical protein AB7N76_01395 [Planctomycetota bacterium]
MGEIDPLELKRRLLAGELDPEEARRLKIAAYQAAKARTRPDRPDVPQRSSSRQKRDPIEAMRQRMARELELRKEQQARLPRHLVVLVRKPRPAPKAAPAPAPAPQPKQLDVEDEITRRIREARERLQGG